MSAVIKQSHPSPNVVMAGLNVNTPVARLAFVNRWNRPKTGPPNVPSERFSGAADRGSCCAITEPSGHLLPFGFKKPKTMSKYLEMEMVTTSVQMNLY